jgi:hypothetical protein
MNPTGATASAGPPQTRIQPGPRQRSPTNGLDPHKGEGAWARAIESAADGLPREKGGITDQQAFVQQYGSGVLDSSLLRMSSVGFVSPHDPM